jgi:hypothetical protein
MGRAPNTVGSPQRGLACRVTLCMGVCVLCPIQQENAASWPSSVAGGAENRGSAVKFFTGAHEFEQ